MGKLKTKSLNNRNLVFLLIIGFLILTFTGLIKWLPSQSERTPDQVIHDFMTAIIERDINTGVSLMFQGCTKTSDEKIKDFENNLVEHPIHSYQILSSTKIKNDNVQYVVRLNGETNLEYNVFRVKGTWLLSYERLGENPNQFIRKGCEK
ncbi:hypothetical protein [Paenibacillus wynnii]|uniref:DUF4878 domain-containing protein n=1 Tax=Paenibacillus wynnii TaxID=268407 RepID=A0A098M492_9BACL|nr:hypothetical protein [Paenibacillus wynnii]KGE16843.1 hypothetical protein PWYN_19360 [Paenibacillus wynnii]